MNKILKRKLIGSIICIILGIISFIYPMTLGKNINDELHSYLCGFTGGILAVGIYTLIIVINACGKPDKEKKLENQMNDERLNSINNTSMSITFKISLFTEAIISIVCAFTNNMVISRYFGFAICIQLIVYVIVYFIINKVK